jgi:hypothetical protein
MRAVFLQYRERRLETPCWMGGLKYEDHDAKNNLENERKNRPTTIESRLSSGMASGMQTRAAMAPTSGAASRSGFTGHSRNGLYTPPAVPQLFSFPHRPTTASGEREASYRSSQGSKKQLRPRPKTAGMIPGSRQTKSASDGAERLPSARKKVLQPPENGSQTERKMSAKETDGNRHADGNVDAGLPSGRNIFYTLHVKILGIKGMAREFR